MKGRLWRCDPQWRCLHSQQVQFTDWPKVGRVFTFEMESGRSHTTEAVQVVAQRPADVVRFETKGARFELEKL